MSQYKSPDKLIRKQFAVMDTLNNRISYLMDEIERLKREVLSKQLDAYSRLHGERNELKKNTDVYLDRIDKLTQENINRDQTIKALRDVVGRQLDAYNRLHYEIEELEKLDWFACIKRHEDTIRKLMKEKEQLENREMLKILQRQISGMETEIKNKDITIEELKDIDGRYVKLTLEAYEELKKAAAEVTEKYNSLGGSYIDLTKENEKLQEENNLLKECNTRINKMYCESENKIDELEKRAGEVI